MFRSCPFSAPKHPIKLLSICNLMESSELIPLLRRGEEDAFKQLFNLYRGRIFAFVSKALPYSEDAESIVQDIFIKIWINRVKLDETRSLNAFIFRVAKNEIYDYLRKELVKKRFIDQYRGQDNSLDTEKQVHASELQRLIDDVIENMPDRRREIFLLSRNERLTYKEIAKQLNISENSVDTQIRNALNSLRKALKQSTLM